MNKAKSALKLGLKNLKQKEKESYCLRSESGSPGPSCSGGAISHPGTATRRYKIRKMKIEMELPQEDTK